MILIFTENDNTCAKQVARYLVLNNANFIIFTETDTIDITYQLIGADLDAKILRNGKFVANYVDIKSVWCHRIDVNVGNIQKKHSFSKDTYDYMFHYLHEKAESVRYMLHNKKCLGYFGKYNNNKVQFLDECRKLNIPYPETIISGLKQDVINFKSKVKTDLIVKSLGIPFQTRLNETSRFDYWYQSGTTLIDDRMLEQLPVQFDLSLFQKKLDKKYELRVFYLNGICFTQIIFSQQTEGAELDYRAGFESNMRQSNFTLPVHVADQVVSIMQKLSLNNGSLDIVVTKDNDFVFLEVNPSGQFGAVSELTNGNFHYQIAHFLSINK